MSSVMIALRLNQKEDLECGTYNQYNMYQKLPRKTIIMLILI